MSKKAAWIVPVMLEGHFVRLEPIKPKHARQLAKVVDPEFFRYFLGGEPTEASVPAMRAYIQHVRQLANTIPFAIIDLERRRAVGMTSYMDIRDEHLGLEIGRTWLAHEAQGTKINPEAKLLLLEHAFDRCRAERVQIKTDSRNLQSRAAIEKLGAKFEGTLRKQFKMSDGYQRDTVMFSIIREDWPMVKERLVKRLAPFK